MLHPSIPAGEELSLAKWAQSIRRSPLQDMLFAASKPGIISFAMGLPAPEFFPSRGFAQACAQVLGHEPLALQYNPPLRSLKKHVVELMSLRGVKCREEQVFLTTGAQQGMNLLVRLLLEPGGQVIAEELIYTGFQQVIEPFEPEVLTVPTDGEEGMNVQAVESLLRGGARPAFIYAISDGHNPLGVSLSEDKRRHLVEVARRYGVPILEDDPYGFLFYGREALPPLRAFDEDWVLYIGSFSKILAPALRVGWLVVPETIISQLSVVKEASDIDTTTFSQRVISAFFDAQDIHAHLSTLRDEYRTRRDCMIQAITEHFPASARWRVPGSGLFLWINMPPEVNMLELLPAVLQTEQVAYIPGQAFGVGTVPLATNCMRLNFSNCTPEKITEGIKRLGRVLKQHTAA